jgi:hypothetical protein
MTDNNTTSTHDSQTYVQQNAKNNEPYVYFEEVLNQKQNTLKKKINIGLFTFALTSQIVGNKYDIEYIKPSYQLSLIGKGMTGLSEIIGKKLAQYSDIAYLFQNLYDLFVKIFKPIYEIIRDSFYDIFGTLFNIIYNVIKSFFDGYAINVKNTTNEGLSILTTILFYGSLFVFVNCILEGFGYMKKIPYIRPSYYLINLFGKQLYDLGTFFTGLYSDIAIVLSNLLEYIKKYIDILINYFEPLKIMYETGKPILSKAYEVFIMIPYKTIIYGIDYIKKNNLNENNKNNILTKLFYFGLIITTPFIVYKLKY